MHFANRNGTHQPYKLRLRCVSCYSESCPRVEVPAARAGPYEIERTIRTMLTFIPYECERCAGERASLVAFFAEAAA